MSLEEAEGFRFSEVLSALSIVLDLVEGQPEGHAVRSCLIGMKVGLTDEECAKIKQHPRLTYDILSRVGPFRPIAGTAANHHEKLDGSGYHRGLGAEDLDLPSRMLAVADIYDALSADRPYHEALPQERVIDILREESGTRLDPESVAILEDLAAENAL